MKYFSLPAVLLVASVARAWYQEYRLSEKMCGQLPDQFGPWPLDSFILTKTMEFFIPLKSDEVGEGSEVSATAVIDVTNCIRMLSNFSKAESTF